MLGRAPIEVAYKILRACPDGNLSKQAYAIAREYMGIEESFGMFNSAEAARRAMHTMDLHILWTRTTHDPVERIARLTKFLTKE